MASHLRELKKNLEEQIKTTEGDLALAVIQALLGIVDAAITDIEAHTGAPPYAEVLKPEPVKPAWTFSEG